VGASFLGIPASYCLRKSVVSLCPNPIPKSSPCGKNWSRPGTANSPLECENSEDEFTFSSARVKPRPTRTRRLYLTVGQRTTGRSLSTGRGATAAALARRASRRRCLRPGYNTQCQSINTQRILGRSIRSWAFLKCPVVRSKVQFGRIWVSNSYLVEVHAHTLLPVLVEV
jgi:hypothetical protein